MAAGAASISKAGANKASSSQCKAGFEGPALRGGCNPSLVVPTDRCRLLEVKPTCRVYLDLLDAISMAVPVLFVTSLSRSVSPPVPVCG